MKEKQTMPREQGQKKKHLIRLLAAAALVAVAASAFAFGIRGLITASAGPHTVECTAREANCAGDFILTYQLGVSGLSPTAELKAVSNLYNERAVYYYKLFHPKQQFEDVVNVAALNASPNKALALPQPLYAALKTMCAGNARYLYLAPCWAYYETLFASSYDEDAAEWDPQRNPALRKEYDRTLVFLSDDKSVSISFLDDYQAVLNVSDAYLAYAKEAGITSFIDFAWMKNAFIADLLADDLQVAGFPYGAIVSRDGFIRNTDPGETEYSYDIFDERGGAVRAVGRLLYTGSASICALHPFVLDDAENLLTYKYADGTRVTRYISPQDALPHGPAGAVAAFSKDLSCAELLMALLPYYMDDSVSAFSLPAAGLLYSDGRAIQTVPLPGFTFTGL